MKRTRRDFHTHPLILPDLISPGPLVESRGVRVGCETSVPQNGACFHRRDRDGYERRNELGQEDHLGEGLK